MAEKKLKIEIPQDLKSWYAISCPTGGLRFDARTLELLDSNRDGHIRSEEVQAAVAFLKDKGVELDQLAEPDPGLEEKLADVLKRIDELANAEPSAADKKALADSLEAYQKFASPTDLVAVSALRNENTDLLMEVLYRHLPEGPMFYDEDTVTEQPMRDIAAEMIREQALRPLRDEIPHGIAVTVESMKERENGIIDLEASIICERDSHKGMIIGKGGQMLKRIGTGARIAIEEMCEAKVNLKLWVKVRRDWRDDETQLKSFGYDARKLR